MYWYCNLLSNYTYRWTVECNFTYDINSENYKCIYTSLYILAFWEKIYGSNMIKTMFILHETIIKHNTLVPSLMRGFTDRNIIMAIDILTQFDK